MILHAHPLSSFCWKVLIALYEKEISFEQRMADVGSAEGRAAFAALWPIAKMPVLEDAGRVVPETSIIIEYLDRLHPQPPRLIPGEAEAAQAVRLADRIYDLYVQVPMQKIVADRLRPAGARDAYGVAEARRLLETGCGLVDRDLAERAFAAGEAFSLADCAAMPALFYADKVMPLAERFGAAAAYLERMKERPSFARVLREAEPWFRYFPEEER
ncbi:MAG: glutathione S-transferase family protein [Allosphingosinicella sp.]